jgi:hypothetical protein
MVLRNFLEVMLISDTRLSLSLASLSIVFSYRHHSHIESPATPRLSAGFRLFRVRSPLLTESLLISLPRPTEMFQFERYPTRRYSGPHTVYKVKFLCIVLTTHKEIFNLKFKI